MYPEVIEPLMGRLPPHPDIPDHARLKLGDFLLDGYATVTPATVDWMSSVDVWPMFGNDRLRDCAAASPAHLEEAWSRYGRGTTVTVTDTDVIRFYEQISGYNPVDPRTDRGAVLQDALDAWRRVGIAGHRILGFAQLDHTNQVQCKTGLYWFGGLYVGVNLPRSALTQTRASAPWGFDPVADNTILGGHAIHVGACSATGVWGGVTWGRSQRITSEWWSRYVEEVWVPVSGEWLNTQGVSPTHLDGAAMNAAFLELTKEPGPFPVTPPPAPPPTAPSDPHATLALAVGHWARGPHIPGTSASKAARAILDWRRATGI